jgi:hypothetical protein
VQKYGRSATDLNSLECKHGAIHNFGLFQRFRRMVKEKANISVTCHRLFDPHSEIATQLQGECPADEKRLIVESDDAVGEVSTAGATE